MLKNSSRLDAIANMFFLVTAFIAVVSTIFPSLFGNFYNALNVTAVVFGAMGSITSAVAGLRRRREIEEAINSKQRELRSAETHPNIDTDIFDFVLSQVRTAATREELAMLRAERRADKLYSRGALLIYVSVLCPIISASLYWQLNPLTAETIDNITKLKNIIGDATKELGVSAARDWRVLFFGVTFGFLCLAAARGILAQQAKEMKVYFDLSEKVNYFERLASVIVITKRYIKEGDDKVIESVRELANKLLDYPSGRNGNSKSEADDNREFLAKTPF